MSSNIPPFPEGPGNFYSFGAHRIARYLAKHGMPVPEQQALQKVLLERFDDIDYLAAGWLLEKKDTSDWHAVITGEVDCDLSRYPLQAAPTLNDALASVLEICDRERIFPTNVDRLPDGIRLWVRDKMFADIRRIRFETCQPKHCQRVQNALKGVRVHGENERMVAKLRSLPGFASIEFRLGQDHHQEPRGNLLLPFPANWAKAMMAAMESLGAPVKHHIAQELVARLFGADSWQHLVAHDDEPRVWTTPFVVATSIHGCRDLAVLPDRGRRRLEVRKEVGILEWKTPADRQMWRCHNVARLSCLHGPSRKPSRP